MASKTAKPSTVPFADAPINAALTPEKKIDLLRTNRRRSSYELAARIAEERAALREAHSV